MKSSLLTMMIPLDTQIEQSFKGSDAYHLMELNLEKNTVVLQAFSQKHLEDAEDLYRIKEERTAHHPHIAIVLISAGNIRQIKKAYPNYFLDTKNFTSSLQKMLR